MLGFAIRVTVRGAACVLIISAMAVSAIAAVQAGGPAPGSGALLPAAFAVALAAFAVRASGGRPRT